MTNVDGIPGRLSGAGIRTLKGAQREAILARIQAKQPGRKLNVRSVRYRVTGFRDPASGQWVRRNPRNGHYYRRLPGHRHNTQLRPTPSMLARSPLIAVEVEADLGNGPRLHYTTLKNRRGR